MTKRAKELAIHDKDTGSSEFQIAQLTDKIENLSKHIKEFKKLNCQVFGISKDSVKKHQNFIKKQNLLVDLLSDEASNVCESYGVWVEKSMYGRKYMGIERSTFLIDAKGKLVQEWRKVKVTGHAKEVLEAAKEL